MVNPLTLLVFEALRNAQENGHGFLGWSIEDIAIDMQSHDSDIEDYSIDEIIEVLARLL